MGAWPRPLPALLALLAIGGALPALWLAPRMFFASWLVAWWICLGLMLGARVNLWIHRLTGGGWGELLRPAALPLARRMPALLLLLVPLLAGLRQLYPWAADASGGWAHELARPAFVLAWLQPGFFGLRLLVYAAAWWLLSRPEVLGGGKGRAAAALVLHVIVGTLAAVDLLMSLLPGWFSSAFGLVVLSAQALGGTALSVVLRAGFGGPAPPPTRHAPPPWRDAGNLLLTWLLLWAYLAFMEFLIIWAGNLPHEIAWYLPRLHSGWVGIGLVLVLAQFALPLAALLSRALKDRPRRLAAIAAGVLLAQLPGAAWLVLPSVDPHSLLGWWLVPLLTTGFALLLFSGLVRELAAAPHPAGAAEGQHARA